MINPFTKLVRGHLLRAARSVQRRPEALLKAVNFPVSTENVNALRALCATVIEEGGNLPAVKLGALKELIAYEQ